MINNKRINLFPNTHKLCYFNSFIQILASIDPIYESIITTPGPVSSCIKSLFNHATDSRSYFLKLKENPVFDGFEHDTEHDALSFGDVLLTELCRENKALPTSFTINLTSTFNLICGHHRSVSETFNFLPISLQKESPIQEVLNSIYHMSFIPFDKHILCLECLERVRVLQKQILEFEPGEYVMVEIDRVLCIDSAKSEFEGKMSVCERIVIGQRVYTFVSAVLYRDGHYTVLVGNGSDMVYVDDDRGGVVRVEDGYEMCGWYGRMVVYRCRVDDG